MTVACRDVEAATLALDGSPPITRTTFPTCRAHYPGGSSGCACRLLPRSYSLPQMAGGSASALSLSRPAQASLTLRPAGLLNRLKRPLSRGSSPAGYPAEPLVSYQINRQLSGWNLPPLVIRAFGAHCQTQTWRGRLPKEKAARRRLFNSTPINSDQCWALIARRHDVVAELVVQAGAGDRDDLMDDLGLQTDDEVEVVFPYKEDAA